MKLLIWLVCVAWFVEVFERDGGVCVGWRVVD